MSSPARSAAMRRSSRQHRLIPVLNSLPQIELWSRWCAARRASARCPRRCTSIPACRAWASPPVELDRLVADPAPLDGIPGSAGDVASRLSPRSRIIPMNAAQLARFRSALDRLLPLLPERPTVSFANSSGIFLGPDYPFDLVRPGAALYGINPDAGSP